MKVFLHRSVSRQNRTHIRETNLYMGPPGKRKTTESSPDIVKELSGCIDRVHQFYLNIYRFIKYSGYSFKTKAPGS